MRSGTLALAVCAALFGCGTEDDQATPEDAGVRTTYPASGYGTTEGSVLANLSFVDSNGAPFSMEQQVFLASNPERKLLLLTTTAGWCTACIEEQPVLEALHQEYAARGLQIVVSIFEDVNFETATVEDAATWKERFGLSFPVVADIPFVLAEYYDRNLTPMNMIVDVSTMTILSVAVGWDESAVRAIIGAKL